MGQHKNKKMEMSLNLIEVCPSARQVHLSNACGTDQTELGQHLQEIWKKEACEKDDQIQKCKTQVGKTHPCQMLAHATKSLAEVKQIEDKKVKDLSIAQFVPSGPAVQAV